MFSFRLFYGFSSLPLTFFPAWNISRPDSSRQSNRRENCEMKFSYTYTFEQFNKMFMISRIQLSANRRATPAANDDDDEAPVACCVVYVSGVLGKKNFMNYFSVVNLRMDRRTHTRLEIGSMLLHLWRVKKICQEIAQRRPERVTETCRRVPRKNRWMSWKI